MVTKDLGKNEGTYKNLKAIINPTSIKNVLNYS